MARAVTDPKLLAELEGTDQKQPPMGGVVDYMPKQSTGSMIMEWARGMAGQGAEDARHPIQALKNYWKPFEPYKASDPNVVDSVPHESRLGMVKEWANQLPQEFGRAGTTGRTSPIMGSAYAETLPTTPASIGTGQQGQQALTSLNNSSMNSTRGQAITDPNLIAELEGASPPSALQAGASQFSQFANRPFPTFPEMLQKIPDYASKFAGKAGEAATEQLGKRQVNPYVSAGVGTAIGMAPDIGMMMINPGESPGVSKQAIPFARRALGYAKRLLPTSYARGRAAQAAETALAQDIIPKMGSPEVMAERAGALKNKAGSAIGYIRDSVGKVGVDPILRRLDELKQELVGKNVGGDWEEISNKIERAKQSISGIGGPPEPVMGMQPIEKNTGILNPKGKPVMKTEMQPVQVGEFKRPVGLSEVGKLKARKANQMNWLTDLASQNDGKKIVATIEKGMEDIMKQAGADMGKYKTAKALFGDTSSMLKALNNELSKQGNMPLSLPSIIAAGGELATGNVPGALMTAGLGELAKRRGAGIAARGINDISRAGPNIGMKSSVLSNILKRRRMQDADSNSQ